MVVLALIVLVALAVSGLCSILEASLLSARPVSLRRRAADGDAGAGRLLAIKEERLEDAIGAILTYNTIAHTVGAALSGAQAAVVFGDAWVGLFSGILTVLILVFTEIIPKTVGTVHADRLAGFSGRVIGWMMKPPMRWLLAVMRVLTRLVAPAEPHRTTRGDVVAMVEIAERDGALASRESAVVGNVLRLERVDVRDVMTPRTVLTMARATERVGPFVVTPAVRQFSRIPIYGETVDDVLGYVLVRQLLEAALEPASRERTLAEFLRPVVVLEEGTSCLEALERLTGEGEHFALVLDELGVLSGLVSLEDIFETALGVEIVDERDEVPDLRERAMALRERRLARMASLRSPSAEDAETERS